VATDQGELRTVLGYLGDDVGVVPPVEFDHTIPPEKAAKRIGFDHYRPLNQEIIAQIEEETGVDIRSFNNRYHIDLEGGVNPRRYSEEAIELFEKVKNGETYSLDIPEERIPD